MKLKNWNKLNGQLFSVMGIQFQLEQAEQRGTDAYTVWINEEISKSPISIMRVDLYLDNMEIDIKTFPVEFPKPPYHTSKKITKDHIKNPSIFIQTLGSMMMRDTNIINVLYYLISVSSKGSS